jgi:hypothetical protein
LSEARLAIGDEGSPAERSVKETVRPQRARRRASLGMSV